MGSIPNWTDAQYAAWLKNTNVPTFDYSGLVSGDRIGYAMQAAAGKIPELTTLTQQMNQQQLQANARGYILSPNGYVAMNTSQIGDYWKFVNALVPPPLSQHDLTTQQNVDNRPRLQATGTPTGSGGTPRGQEPVPGSLLGNTPLNLAIPSLLGATS